MRKSRLAALLYLHPVFLRSTGISQKHFYAPPCAQSVDPCPGFPKPDHPKVQKRDEEQRTNLSRITRHSEQHFPETQHPASTDRICLSAPVQSIKTIRGIPPTRHPTRRMPLSRIMSNTYDT
jgi:hypothetical protein